jgi:hypothetical protein
MHGTGLHHLCLLLIQYVVYTTVSDTDRRLAAAEHTKKPYRRVTAPRQENVLADNATATSSYRTWSSWSWPDPTRPNPTRPPARSSRLPRRPGPTGGPRAGPHPRTRTRRGEQQEPKGTGRRPLRPRHVSPQGTTPRGRESNGTGDPSGWR